VTRNCEEKVRYQRLPIAYNEIRRLNRLGETGLHPYVCLVHQCIHIGHTTPLRRSYDSWDAAMSAALSMLAVRSDMPRARVFKNGDKWTVMAVIPDPGPAGPRIPPVIHPGPRPIPRPIEGLERQPPPGVLDGVTFRVVRRVE
jgi:predicted RNase H-like nuclease